MTTSRSFGIITLAASSALLLFHAHAAIGTPTPVATWDDHPGIDYQPASTEAAPCGTSTPARGHFVRDVFPADLPQGLTLTVKQDPNRLCYVADGIAEAPVIRIRQGQELAVTLRNEITDAAAIDNYVAAGKLDTPNAPVPSLAGFYGVVPGKHHSATGITNLHVHGFAVPPVAPQDEVLDTCVDPAFGSPVCGHREVTYRYQIPPDMPAGLYWYHPHVHGEVQAQILMGLSGAIVVEGPEDDARRAAGIKDRVLIVRQSQDNDAKPAPAAAAQPAVVTESASMPRTDGHTIDTAHELLCSPNSGTDLITLNGAKVLDGVTQDAELAHYEIPAGRTELWRVLNAATDAFLDVALVDEDGNPLPLTIVARDGAPLTDDTGRRIAPSPTTQSRPVPPSGRLEFLIPAPPGGRKAYLVTHAVDTGCAGDKVPERRLALVTATGDTAETRIEAPATKPAPNFFSGLISRKTDRTRVIAFAEYPRPGTEDQTDFYIAELKPGAILRPYEMGAPPAITVNAGTTEEWVVENWTHELHAFHIHQVHFRVLEVDGVKVPDTPLLDVVTVPYARAAGFRSRVGPVIPGRVRVKLFFPEALAGDIPFHCHLVDHEDNGMMAVLRVLPDKSAAMVRKAELLGTHPPICRSPSR